MVSFVRRMPVLDHAAEPLRVAPPGPVAKSFRLAARETTVTLPICRAESEVATMTRSQVLLMLATYAPVRETGGPCQEVAAGFRDVVEAAGGGFPAEEMIDEAVVGIFENVRQAGGAARVRTLRSG